MPDASPGDCCCISAHHHTLSTYLLLYIPVLHTIHTRSIQFFSTLTAKMVAKGAKKPAAKKAAPKKAAVPVKAVEAAVSTHAVAGC